MSINSGEQKETTESGKTRGKSPQEKAKEQRRRQRQRERGVALLELLNERWPTTFPKEPGGIRPWAVNLRQDVVERLQGHSKGVIRHALRVWREKFAEAYLLALVAGGRRYDLDGNPRGDVTPEDQACAGKELEALRAHGGHGAVQGKPEGP